MEKKPLQFLLLQDLDKRMDFYTPLLIMNTTFLKEHSDLAKNILAAIEEGYQYAIQNPDEAAKILYEYNPETDLEFLIQSQRYVSQRYIEDSSRWGEMKPEIWETFTQFLLDSGAITEDFDIMKAFTNDFLP